MDLRVVGAGLGRTGTYSLKLALERLLGAPCYHMAEVFDHPEHVPLWHAAARGDLPDWHNLVAGYGAAVDWPASAFWRELSQAFPNALILLSLRDAEAWWDSASNTIFPSSQHGKEGERKEWFAMVEEVFRDRFTTDINDREACLAAFERHNEEVFRTAPAERLLVWRATDGWAPICNALGLPIPDEPFPKANTREEFLARVSVQ